MEEKSDYISKKISLCNVVCAAEHAGKVKGKGCNEWPLVRSKTWSWIEVCGDLS